MFTGIIEEVGSLKESKKSAKQYVLTINAKKVLEDVQLGDSIAVNGVCLTVTSFTTDSFTVDVMPETLKATSLQTLERGSKVNLERAMAAGSRFGGHIVSGHVDGLGRIKSRKEVANAIYFEIETTAELSRYIIKKGSICVDGISLTVVEVEGNQFSISIIPHTLAETNLQYRDRGDRVNLECDMLAKYMEKLLEKRFPATKQGITLESLAEHGYL